MIAPLIYLGDTATAPMIWQRVLWMGVLQCIGGRSEEDAHRVHISRESTIKFVNDERKTVKEKTYDFNIEVVWNRKMFGRAVKMLGERIQSEVRAEDVEEVLQAMGYLSTVTEGKEKIRWYRRVMERAMEILRNMVKGIIGTSKKIHKPEEAEKSSENVSWYRRVIERAMEILRNMVPGIIGTSKKIHKPEEAEKSSKKIRWSREMFERAVKRLGKRIQGKVKAKEMEEILYAMDYLKTGRVDMVHVSESLDAGAERSKTSVELVCDIEIFEMAYNILADKEEEVVSAKDIVEILYLIDYLNIRREWETVCYTKLAEKAMEDHKRVGKETAIREIESLRKRMVKKGRKTRSFVLYIQHVLGMCVSKCGMRLTVNEENKTLDLRSRSSKERWSTNRTEECVLRVEVSKDYRKDGVLQSIVETLIDVMGIAVEVYIEDYKPEDRFMLKRMISMAREMWLSIQYKNIGDIEMLKSIISETQAIKLSIKYRYAESGEVVRHMKGLSLVVLNVSESISLSNEDWETIGKMAKLERLYIRNCNMQAGIIAHLMLGLNLTDLDVSWNTKLGDEDWTTIGKMANLERLYIRYCNVKAGTIARYMNGLDLVGLDVSWNVNLSNDDWKTIGRMANLKRLDMGSCDIQAGRIAEHMKRLNLSDLDVSDNYYLSGRDWETIGKMTSLERVDMGSCDIQAGRIAEHMKRLNLSDLDVSGSKNLSGKDWETIGKMTRLEKLYISLCNIEAGAIARYMNGLGLVELDVSESKNLSDEDWTAIGRMAKLESLNISLCNIPAGAIAEHMVGLKDNLVELNVSGNRSLSDEDWETIGKMAKLEKLYIRVCNLQAGTIARYIRSLDLVELDVSDNANLSNEDLGAIGRMATLEKLYIGRCNISEEQFTKYLERLKCKIYR